MSLHQQLSAVENEIDSICIRRGVGPDEIEMRADEFTYDESHELVSLLNIKLDLQKKIYAQQGGDLSNVILFSERRKR